MSVDNEQHTDDVCARFAKTMIGTGKVEAFKKFAAEITAAQSAAGFEIDCGPAELVAKVARLLA